MSEKHNGLNTLWKARDEIPDERRQEFNNMLLGALSVSCPEHIWKDTIELVKNTVLREEIDHV